MAVPTSNALADVWGRDATNQWAVGDLGTILAFNGTTWTAQPSPTQNALNAMWGSSPSEMWIVGNAATILRYRP